LEIVCEFVVGGSIVGFHRQAFLQMAQEMQTNPPAILLDLYQKAMGERWNKSKRSLQCWVHPERGGPHIRVSTTLVSEKNVRREFGGSLCPDGADPTGLLVLAETGPDEYVQFAKALEQSGKIGRTWRRGTDVPINIGVERPRISGSTLAIGVPGLYFFDGIRWAPSPFLRGETWALNARGVISARFDLKLPDDASCTQSVLEKETPVFKSILAALRESEHGAYAFGVGLKQHRHSEAAAAGRTSIPTSACNTVYLDFCDENVTDAKHRMEFEDIVKEICGSHTAESRHRGHYHREHEPDVFLGALQQMEPPSWEDVRTTFAFSRLPESIHFDDARFEKRAGKRSCLCDCTGCYSDQAELEDLQAKYEGMRRAGDMNGLASLTLMTCCKARPPWAERSAPYHSRDSDGNWDCEAVWCQGGARKRLAWEHGIINAEWLCWHCIARRRQIDTRSLLDDFFARQNREGGRAERAHSFKSKTSPSSLLSVSKMIKFTFDSHLSVKARALSELLKNDEAKRRRV
jgi:hypothetical protein